MKVGLVSGHHARTPPVASRTANVVPYGTGRGGRPVMRVVIVPASQNGDRYKSGEGIYGRAARRITDSAS